ncbi:MAG: leucine-rich repeat domain-containing protein, partial [Desulfovibrio sp.]|nr:leucine-rich repeat domain-containing protein [Desulfovibrio sp.]
LSDAEAAEPTFTMPERDVVLGAQLFGYESNGDGMTVTQVGGDISGLLEIPETLGGSSVTVIGPGAVRGVSSVTEVVLPNTVTNIREQAFMNLPALTNVVLNEGLRHIGFEAFCGAGLSEVTIPASVKILDSAFQSCADLAEVRFAEGSELKQLWNSTFSGCSSLTGLEIPDTVTYIGARSFKGCSSLTELVIPNLVTSIGEQTFKGCASLTNIVLGAGLTSLDYTAFEGCSSLENVTYEGTDEGVLAVLARLNLGTGIMLSEDGTEFIYLGGHDTVTIPDGVTNIAASAFRGQTELSALTPSSASRGKRVALQSQRPMRKLSTGPAWKLRARPKSRSRRAWSRPAGSLSVRRGWPSAPRASPASKGGVLQWCRWQPISAPCRSRMRSSTRQAAASLKTAQEQKRVRGKPSSSESGASAGRVCTLAAVQPSRA